MFVGHFGPSPAFPLIQLPRKSEANLDFIRQKILPRKFPLIQLPRKSEELGGPHATPLGVEFPLIQLPRKSEEKNK